MSAHGDSTLDRELHELAAGVAHRRQANLVARSMEVARATRANDRAWALVRLAADLRALERYDEALHVLDTAWWISDDDHAVLGMFTCAIAIHCDRNDHEIAVVLERDFADRAVDLKFARVCMRLYAELHRATDADEHRARRDSYGLLVESLADDEQAVIAA